MIKTFKQGVEFLQDLLTKDPFDFETITSISITNKLRAGIKFPPVYTRDDVFKVFKEFKQEIYEVSITGKFITKSMSSLHGPCIIDEANGLKKYYIDNVELSFDEWTRHPEVIKYRLKQLAV